MSLTGFYLFVICINATIFVCLPSSNEGCKIKERMNVDTDKCSAVLSCAGQREMVPLEHHCLGGGMGFL